MTDFIFLGSKIIVNGDYSHKIKRRLLLGRKAMTNLDSILKRRDITLLTKVCIVKAMVFPIVIYGCERPKRKQSTEELRLSNCGTEKILESPLDGKEIKPVKPKGNHEYSVEGLMLKLQYFGHLMGRVDSLEKTLMLGKIEGMRRRATEDKMDGWHH